MKKQKKDDKKKKSKEILKNKNIELIDEYINKRTWKVKENSNMGYSLQGLNNHISSMNVQEYWMEKIYDDEIKNAHKSGEIHVHDASSLSSYCCGFDLFDFLEQGLCGVPGKIESGPPKHLSSALGQIVNFIFSVQGECFSSDTDILTKDGWKKFYETTDDDMFCTIDLNDKKITYVKRTRYIEKVVDEELINFKSVFTDLLVTKLHRMLVYDHSKRKFQIKPAKDVTTKETISLFHDVKDRMFSGAIDEISNVNYKGKVYCVEVPNGIIAVKRNNKMNFVGNCAGAIAFSSFDTLIAPFIRYDKLNYDQVKQAMQEFIFNLNIPTRVGFQCLSEDTEILTPNGWKRHNQLKSGEDIFTFNKKNSKIEILPINFLFARKFSGEMYNIKTKNTDQLLTEGHRTICFNDYYRSDNSLEKHKFVEVNEIYESKESFKMPYMVNNAIRYEKITSLNIKKQNYDGVVWCPNTDNETVIAKRNGLVFITGNTPFSNLTLDLDVSENYAEMPILLGGKTDWELDEAGDIVENGKGKTKALYKEFQNEMDILNRAFCEVMTEGDAKGKIFTFPIPTCNITKDFDWDNKNRDAIWEATSKYGIFYFSNFVNSDMKPSDTRSMCCLPGDTEVIYKDKNGYPSKDTIKEIVNDMIENGNRYKILVNNDKYEWTKHPIKIEYNDELVQIEMENCIVQQFTKNHPCLTKNGIIKAENLTIKDEITFRKGCICSHKISNALNEDENYYYEKIKDIKLIPFNGYVYDFEMDSDDHLFSLANGIVTHNCRLRIDNTELQKKGGGLFGANPLTGSCGVVTLNLSRVGYKAKGNEEKYFKEIDRLLEISRKSLKIKRKIIEELTENGLYPYIKHYLKKIKKTRKSYWANHFNTIGILGMHESCINFMGKGIDSEEGVALTIKMMKHIREKIQHFQEEDGFFYNLEATPGEGTTYTFAKKDKEEFGKSIYISGEDRSYYTNSTSLPVDFSNDIFEVLDNQDKSIIFYNGGSTVHLHLGERIDDPMVCKKLVKKITDTYHLPYFSISPVFTVCPKHGYISGEHKTCPYDNEDEK